MPAPTEKKLSAAQILSRKRREVFLKVLARTGKVIEAARAIGLTQTTSLYQQRNEDEDFSAAWDAAILASADLLEEAAWDRAVKGVEKPILFKGEVVATEVQYSDALLIRMLESRKKEYQKRDKLDVNIDLNAKVGIAVLPMTAADPSQWEKQALVVHEAQRALPAFDDPTKGAVDAEFEEVSVTEKPKVAEKKSGPVTLERG